MTNELNFSIGMRVRRQREYLGYTREELAEKIDISVKFLSDIECGMRGMSLPTLIKMCSALKVTTDYIILGKETVTDNARIADIFRNIDAKYIPYAEELLKVFIKAID